MAMLYYDGNTIGNHARHVAAHGSMEKTLKLVREWPNALLAEFEAAIDAVKKERGNAPE
jgi:hypothetical protein